MKFSSSTLVLATLATGQAVAATVGHAGKHNHAARHAEMVRAMNEKRDNAKRDLAILSAVDIAALTKLGIATLGLNPTVANAHSWIGTDGAFTNEFFNQGTEDISLVVWGPVGSWVNAVQPHITMSIPANSSKTVSFASGASGAWAPVYSDTKLVNGQISETWGEFTFGPYGVVDVSREVNMLGKNMTIVGPSCVTSMDTCVFVCGNGETVCTYGYELLNCANGSQKGANYGTYDGAPSGGCGGMGDSAALKTYLN